MASAEELAAVAARLEVRAYVLDGEGGAVELGRLELCGHPEEAPLRGLTATIDDNEAELWSKEGPIHLVVLEAGEVKNIARLCFLEGRPVAGTRVEGEAEAEEAGTSDEDEEKAKEAEEEEEEDEAGSSEEEEEEEEDEAWSSEEEDEDGEKHYSVQIRLWPGLARAVLVLFDGSFWKLTREHYVHWLQDYEQDEMLKVVRIGAGINTDINANTQASSVWSQDSIHRLDFEGPLDNSIYLEKLICAELSASMDVFRVIRVLGKGASGEVYKCSYLDTSTNDTAYAIKKMEITKYHDDIDTINNKEPREVNIMSCLKDHYAVKFYKSWAADGVYKSYTMSDSDDDAYASKDDLCEPKYVIIQMESCLRTLKDVLPFGPREINIKESWGLFEEITRAVQCLHHKGIIHRDLKPDNIFIGSNGTLKIGDFGHACWAKDKIGELIGTPNRGSEMYMAPELDGGQVTNKVDIYSMGAIFVELFYPFNTGQEKCEVFLKLRSNVYPTEWEGDTALLKQLTASSPSHRPSTDEILEYIVQRQNSIDGQN